MEKLCMRCRQIKNEKEFYKRPDGVEYKYCRKCHREITDENTARRVYERKSILKVFGNECEDCSETNLNKLVLTWDESTGHELVCIKCAGKRIKRMIENGRA